LDYRFHDPPFFLAFIQIETEIAIEIGFSGPRHYGTPSCPMFFAHQNILYT